MAYLFMFDTQETVKEQEHKNQIEIPWNEFLHFVNHFNQIKLKRFQNPYTKWIQKASEILCKHLNNAMVWIKIYPNLLQTFVIRR